ncbi:hypothetical protein [Fontivita pretiosa]|uniref:hypothetical protein n=1 Tax=Fontivita pretiosa TaxID=2989684 RepID=UPI003D168056
MSQENPLEASGDALSRIGRQLLRLDAATAYTRLVVGQAQAGSQAARAMLESITARDLIDGPVHSPDDAEAMLAALWLRHDWLEPAHRIVQRIETETGSFWHAILHRREADFANSKYWYRRAAEHPINPTLAVRAGDIINPYPADKSLFRIIAQGWNASAFVDLVEQLHDRPDDPRHRLCVAIQEIEWQTLFVHCTRAASGR